MTAPGTKTATKKQLEQVLREIAGYVLPTYTFAGESYVPLRYLSMLKSMAKDALKGETP